MPRRGLFVAAVVLTVLGVAWTLTPRTTTPPSTFGTRAGAVAPAPRDTGGATPDPVETPSFARSFAARTATVRDACDLPLEHRCEADRCAAIVESPDLDVLTGWLDILADRPGLVLSTVLRDAGVDPSLLPCGRALDHLGEQPIYSVTDPDTGREWWCTAAAVDGAAPVALCDELVTARRGTPFGRFSATKPRELRFRR